MSRLMLKLGQVAGALLMAAGVASFLADEYDPRSMSAPGMLLGGAALYGLCRVAAWLGDKDRS